MNDERRETNAISTPVGNHLVVLKAYLTGRDRRALRNIWIGEKSGITFDPENNKVTNIVNREMMQKAEEMAWRTIIISIDGKKDGDEVEGKRFDLVEEILAMHEDDFTAIDHAVSDVSSEKKIAKY